MNQDSLLAAIGSIRVWETDFLSEKTVEKMLGAKDFGEAFTVLNDLDFASFLEEVKGPEEFGKVLNMALYHAKSELHRLAPNADVLDILWLLYDLHNAKVILKGELVKNDPLAFEEMILPYASKSTEQMVQLLHSNNAAEENIWIAEAFTAAKKEHAETSDPLKVENTLDTAFFDHILREARKAKNVFVTQFVKHIIDAMNISAAFRARLRAADSFLFIEGGIIARRQLEAKTLETFGDELTSPWREAVLEGKEDFEKTQNVSVFENTLTAVVLQILSAAKSVIDGAEPLIAYFWRKQHDAQIIRTILVGKRAGLSEIAIRRSLPVIL